MALPCCSGIEKIDYDKENPADVKAAERFTKLYDELISSNTRDLISFVT